MKKHLTDRGLGTAQPPGGKYAMKGKQLSPLYRAILQVPFYLLVLFLLYLLGKSFVTLVIGFSLPLGFSETLVHFISGLMLVFLLFIGSAIIMHFVQNKADD